MGLPEPLPDRVRALDVNIAGLPAGQLLRHSVYEFRYQDPRPEQPEVSLLMPARSSPTWRDGDLFPSMDQNIPEGDLLIRLRALVPKQGLTPMQLLALIGQNGIGRVGFQLPGTEPPAAPPTLTREALLRTRYTPAVFDKLVSAYLSTGAGIAGMQPKIMVPARPTVPIPSLIVKAASPAYPGIAANEFLCLQAAHRAGIEVPGHALSDDGQMLVIDRFDLESGTDGQIQRLGFEDIAALGGLRVRDTLSNRKYQGSYQRVAQLLRKFMLGPQDLARFFEQVAFTVMVRNGDGHLKNYGLLYRSSEDMRLAPMFDVVTTAIYRYTQYPGGPELEDRTLALKLFAGKGSSKAYPTTEELLAFGTRVCGVNAPERVLQRIAQGMRETLDDAAGDDRVPKDMLAQLGAMWEIGLAYAQD